MYNFTTSRPVESSHKCDVWLIVSVILLWGFGICTLYICSSYVINGANALNEEVAKQKAEIELLKAKVEFLSDLKRLEREAMWKASKSKKKKSSK